MLLQCSHIVIVQVGLETLAITFTRVLGQASTYLCNIVSVIPNVYNSRFCCPVHAIDKVQELGELLVVDLRCVPDIS